MLPNQISFSVIRRNGERTDFFPEKIYIALGKAFLAVSKQNELASSTREKMTELTRLCYPPWFAKKDRAVCFILKKFRIR